jgi:Ca-activated chloride channel family protein
MTHESLRDISIDITSVRTSELTPNKISSLYHGEQLVILGHYIGQMNTDKKNGSGSEQIATVTIKGRSCDREQAYKSELDYHLVDKTDTKHAITDIAKKYSLLTDYTSMIVVREEVWQQLGISPSNKQRVAKEQLARKTREQNPSMVQVIGNRLALIHAPA